MRDRAPATTVEVWSFRIQDACDLGPALNLISDEEHAQATRFKDDDRREAYIRGHATIRQILATRTGYQARDIRFCRGEYGKPSIAADTNLHINWSHAGDRWILAATQAGPVGADIERIQPGFEWAEAASIAFHPRELAFVNKAAADRVERFYTLWVHKEAAFKAAGFGLHNDMAGTTVVNVEGALARTVAIVDGSTWHIQDVSIAAGYKAAIATDSPSLNVRHVRYDHWTVASGQWACDGNLPRSRARTHQERRTAMALAGRSVGLSDNDMGIPP